MNKMKLYVYTVIGYTKTYGTDYVELEDSDDGELEEVDVVEIQQHFYTGSVPTKLEERYVPDFIQRTYENQNPDLFDVFVYVVPVDEKTLMLTLENQGYIILENMAGVDVDDLGGFIPPPPNA